MNTRVNYVNLDRMNDLLLESLKASFENVIKNCNFVLGPELSVFEKSFASYCNSKFAIGVANGLDAITLSMLAMDISEGDEVILAANSFIATALGVSKCGARPVLVDCDEQTYNIDPKLIEQAVTDKTKAIALTHLYGQSADMDPILNIAKKYNLRVFEDSAQAHGATYKGRKCGNMGDMSGFSFYPTKNLGAYGDGGIILTNDESLAENVRIIRNYGSTQKYVHDVIGCNSRLDELQAGLLSCKLKYLEDWNIKRRALANIYFENLASISEVILPYVPNYSVPVWHVYPIRVPESSRDELITFLNESGVSTNIHYPIPINKQRAYLDEFRGKSFPVSEKVSSEILSLPLDPFHSKEEIEYVSKLVRQFFLNR